MFIEMAGNLRFEILLEGIVPMNLLDTNMNYTQLDLPLLSKAVFSNWVMAHSQALKSPYESKLALKKWKIIESITS